MAQISAADMKEITKLDIELLTDRLKDVNSTDLRKLCGFVGIPQRGAKPEMQEAIVAKIVKERSSQPADPPQSPVGRTGRKRSPRQGLAAATLRGAAAGTGSPTVAEFIGESSEAAPAASSEMPRVEPMPSFKQVIDKSNAGQNTVIGAGMQADDGLLDDSFADSTSVWVAPTASRAPPLGDFQLYAFQGFDGQASDYEIVQFVNGLFHDLLHGFSIEILGTSMGHVGFRIPRAQLDPTLKAIDAQKSNFMFRGKNLTIVGVDAVHSTRFSLPEAPPPEDSMSSDASEASEVTEQVTLQDLMRKMNTMEKRHKRPEKKLKNELKAYVQNTVTDTVAPLAADLQQLSIGQVLMDNRVGALENSMGDTAYDPNDPGLKRISILGIESTDAAKRIREIEAWFSKHFPNIQVRETGNYYKFAQGDGTPKVSTISYVEFTDTIIRDHVIKKVPNKPDLKIEGKSVDVKRGLTRTAMKRNGALKDALKVISGDKRFQGAKISKESGKSDRGIKVNGNFVFTQGPTGLGAFISPFTDLQLPERPSRRRR